MLKRSKCQIHRWATSLRTLCFFVKHVQESTPKRLRQRMCQQRGTFIKKQLQGLVYSTDRFTEHLLLRSAVLSISLLIFGKRLRKRMWQQKGNLIKDQLQGLVCLTDRFTEHLLLRSAVLSISLLIFGIRKNSDRCRHFATFKVSKRFLSIN